VNRFTHKDIFMKHLIIAVVLATLSIPAWSLKVGSAFPSLELTVLDGDKTTVKELISKNNLTIVELWASWCGTCKKSFPHMDQLAKKYKDKGLNVIGLNTDAELDDLSEIRVFLKETAVDFPIVLSNAEEVYKKVGIKGVPFVALVDNKGTVLAFYNTMKKKQKKQLEHELATRLK